MPELKPKVPEGPVPTPQPTRAEADLMATKPAGPDRAPIHGPALQKMMQQIDPNFRLDSAAEEHLLGMASSFVERVTQAACRVARHRNSSKLEVKDIQLILAKQYGMRIPNLSSAGLPPRLASVPGRVAATFSSTNAKPLDPSVAAEEDSSKKRDAPDSGVGEAEEPATKKTTTEMNGKVTMKSSPSKASGKVTPKPVVAK
jgi:histone H3/H4